MHARHQLLREQNLHNHQLVEGIEMVKGMGELVQTRHAAMELLPLAMICEEVVMDAGESAERG